MKSHYRYDMIKCLAKLDWMTPEYMLIVTMAFMDCINGNDEAFSFDYIDFIYALREYDLLGMNADALIDIIVTLKER